MNNRDVSDDVKMIPVFIKERCDELKYSDYCKLMAVFIFHKISSNLHSKEHDYKYLALNSIDLAARLTENNITVTEYNSLDVQILKILDFNLEIVNIYGYLNKICNTLNFESKSSEIDRILLNSNFHLINFRKEDKNEWNIVDIIMIILNKEELSLFLNTYLLSVDYKILERCRNIFNK